MAHPLLFDGTWTQQFKYESAEAFYQQMAAKSGSCQVVQSCHDTVQSAKSAANKSQESNIKSEIAKTRQDIHKALNEGDKTGSCAVDQQVVQRIGALETENKNLKKAAQDLTALVKKLEARVVALEKGTSASAPSALKQQEQKPAKDEEKEESDFDPFGDDDSASEDEATKAALAAYKAKKSNKPVLVAKSSLLIDVKPWDDETDMVEMERLVRTVEMDGLLWGAAKLVPVGYGIKKLQINAVIEDDKVSTDDLEEKITAFGDLVQSMDIAAFNKI